jgi:two-component system sensor histidine kinase/response regulator
MIVRTRYPSRILLAEDNALNRELVLTLLGRWGHTVITASTGSVALAVLERENCDLVLMDLQMPELDGIEATIAIRNNEGTGGRRVPIIAMTAVDSERARCLAAGMDGFISRPVNAAELFDVVEHAVAPPAPVGPAVDTAALLDRCEGDLAWARELAQLSLDEIPQQLATLRAAVEAGDAEAIQRAAHTLKGTVGMLGATVACDVLQRLEAGGRTRDLSESGALSDMLMRELERVRAELASFHTP